MLRSRPTCRGIWRTVIDTARESVHFPLLCIILRLRPMLDQITSTSWPSPMSPHLIGLMPRTPYHTCCLMDSLVPLISLSLSPWRHYDVWPRTRLGPYPFHDIIAYLIPYDKTAALDPDHTYSHSPLAPSSCMMDIPLISDILYNAMTHLGLRHWLILAYPMTMSLTDPYLLWLIPRIVLLGYVICLCLTNILHMLYKS